MTTINGLPYYEIDFNADGSRNTTGGSGDGGLPEAVAAGGIDDLFVFSHGWNNSADTARDLYTRFFGEVAPLAAPGASPGSSRDPCAHSPRRA